MTRREMSIMPAGPFTISKNFDHETEDGYIATNEIRVFYSWQSDLPGDVTIYLIQEMKGADIV